MNFQLFNFQFLLIVCKLIHWDFIENWYLKIENLLRLLSYNFAFWLDYSLSFVINNNLLLLSYHFKLLFSRSKLT